MSTPNKEEYPRANITIDIIVFDRLTKKVLLIKRGREPFKDYWAVPGGFFNPIAHHDEQQDESFLAAGIRELKEETNIDAKESDLEFLCIQDKPGRDPRGRTITAVYTLTLWNGIERLDIKAQDDAVDVKWFDLQSLFRGEVPLAFDHHDEIVKFAPYVISRS